jgi:hypothetical protein
MTVDEAIAFFSAYSSDEKKDFLAVLMQELTIVARDSYEVGADGLTNPQRVRTINEVQHRLAGFLSKLLRADERRYPDETIVRIVLEQTGDDGLAWHMAMAFERAHRLTAGVSVS